LPAIPVQLAIRQLDIELAKFANTKQQTNNKEE
jgi:hypothetical protein